MCGFPSQMRDGRIMLILRDHRRNGTFPHPITLEPIQLCRDKGYVSTKPVRLLFPDRELASQKSCDRSRSCSPSPLHSENSSNKLSIMGGDPQTLNLFYVYPGILISPCILNLISLPCLYIFKVTFQEFCSPVPVRFIIHIRFTLLPNMTVLRFL